MCGSAARARPATTAPRTTDGTARHFQRCAWQITRGQLTGLSPEAEVLAPPRLRERFARDAAPLVALYGT